VFAKNILLPARNCDGRPMSGKREGLRESEGGSSHLIPPPGQRENFVWKVALIRLLDVNGWACSAKGTLCSKRGPWKIREERKKVFGGHFGVRMRLGGATDVA